MFEIDQFVRFSLDFFQKHGDILDNDRAQAMRRDFEAFAASAGPWADLHPEVEVEPAPASPPVDPPVAATQETPKS